MYIDTPEVRTLVARAFPGYNGTKFKVEPFSGPMRLTSYWSGGSIDYWKIVRLTDGKTAGVPENGTPFMPELKECASLPENCCLVRHTIFCGKDMGCTVYVRPENLTPMLPAVPVLTRNEQIVLAATAGLKSSYGGIKNYRFHEAHEITGITESEYEHAKGSCIAKGLLNKAGAITGEGRNAINNVRLENLKNQ